jgi:hypothetical protein
MEIFVAQSSRVYPGASWIMKQLAEYHNRGVNPVSDLGGEGDPVSDDLLEQSDAIVAEFGQPSDELSRQVNMAHQLGKNALAFMPSWSRLGEYLPDFSRYNFQGGNNNCFIQDKPGGPTLVAYRGPMRPMKLKLWVMAQLMEERTRNTPVAERRRIIDKLEREIAAEESGRDDS